MANKFLNGIAVTGAGSFTDQVTIPETPTADDHAASKKYVDDQVPTGVDVAKRIEISVKNISGGQLIKGTVVHAAPSASPPSGNVVEVIAADYDAEANMPAIGILNETLADDTEGVAVMMGAVSGIDTDDFTAGDELYVGADGALTNSKPQTAGQLIQKIAVCVKSHASNGLIKVFGAGRSNDVPLPLHIDNTNQRLGIGLSSPSTTLHVGGFTRINGGLQMNTANATIYQILDSALRFGTNNTERMRIDSSGNVGIGTTTPSSVLDVHGSLGQLFSVTDDLSGDLFSVSDISGMPIFNVNSSGAITFDGYIPDNNKLKFGNSEDLEIYHDGSNSFISDTGTGNLLIRGSANVEIEDTDGVNMARFKKDNSVDLYYDGIKKFETTSTGVSVIGNISAITASGHDFMLGNSNNTTTADTTGFRMHNSATYDDGRYAHRFRKYDHGGGIPLYIDGSGSTANIFTALARFGTYTNEDKAFEVFGKAKATHFYGDGSNLTNVPVGTHNHDGDYIQDGGTTAIANINTIGTESIKHRWNNVTTGRPAEPQANEYGTITTLTYDSSYATQLAWDIHAGNLYGRTLNLGDDTGTWVKFAKDGDYVPASGGTFAGDITLDDNSGASPSLYLTNGDNNYWRIFNGSSLDLTFRVGTVTKFDIDSSGNGTFVGTIGASNFSGSSSGTNTGDQDLSGLLPKSGGTVTGNLTVNGTAQLGNSLSDKAIVHGHLGIGDETSPKIAYPGQNALWGEANNSTVGQVVIDVPGTLNNYDMLYIEIDMYEYNSTNATKLIIGGHNWNSGGDSGTSNLMWYNAGVKVIGSNTKSVYLGWRNDGTNNRRVIAIGETDSTWSYPTIHVSKVHGNDGYSSSMDLIGNWAINLTTSSSYFTKSPTTNFNTATSTTFTTRGNISANNFSGSSSGTNTGDQVLPTDFVSAASGGTFGGNLIIKHPSSPSLTLTDDSPDPDNIGKIDVANTYMNFALDSSDGIASSRMRFQLDGSNIVEILSNTTYFRQTNIHLQNTSTSNLNFRKDAAITAGDDIGKISFTATNDEGASYPVGGNIIYEGDGTWDLSSINNAPTRMKIQLRNSSGTLANAMMLSSNLNANFYGDLTVAGNLTVSGTTTTLNTETIEVEDNIIVLNKTASDSSATAATSGISIYRGLDANNNAVTQASLIFDDGDDTWDLTNNLAVAGDVIGASFAVPSGASTGFLKADGSVDSTTYSGYTFGATDLTFSGADPGDIVWRNADGDEVHRLWSGTNDYLTYRNDAGTTYELISAGSTSYNNTNWDTAYTHSQATHAPTDAEANVQADWNATSGDALILNKPTILVPEFFEEKFAYQSNDLNAVYTPMVKGGLYGTNTSSVTGAIRIDLPSYKSAGMINFYVDIYEYSTGDTVTFRISGYAYNDSGATWHNCSVVNFSDDNNDYNVRFISDTANSKQCVTIGEVDTNWTYPQVLVRDAFSGYNTSESEWKNSWNITFVTSLVGTVRHNFTDNLPYADWDRLEGKPTSFAPTDAEANVQADWNATSGDAHILNKPTIPTDFVSAASGGTFGNALQINHSAFTGLSLTRDDSNGSSIDFSNNNGLLGRVGYLSDGTLAITNSTIGTSNMMSLTSGGDAVFSGSVKINDEAYLDFAKNTDVDGSEVVAQVSTSTYTAAFFDYVIKKGSNVRAGIVYACHDGSNNVEFSETSTTDLGNTSDVALSVDISSGNMRLIADSDTNDWSVKTLIRAI